LHVSAANAGGGRERQALKPGADSRQKAKTGSSGGGAHIQSHPLILPGSGKRPREKSLRESCGLPSKTKKNSQETRQA
jgi:hypothetical protein